MGDCELRCHLQQDKRHRRDVLLPGLVWEGRVHRSVVCRRRERSCADGHELGAGARQFRAILFTLPYENFGSNVSDLGIAVSASEVASTTPSLWES